MKIQEENLTIKNSKKFYDDFAEEFKKGDEIVMDFSQVKRIDLSIVQIIVAAGRKARQEGKTIKLKSVLPEVKDQMMFCGLKL
jgi:anti-anti-sigma regulatory factor